MAVSHVVAVVELALATLCPMFRRVLLKLQHKAMFCVCLRMQETIDEGI
jgi:hypothetical protein